jgi:hypothetical protein
MPERFRHLIWWTFASEVIGELMQATQGIKNPAEVEQILDNKVQAFEVKNLPYYPIEFTKNQRRPCNMAMEHIDKAPPRKSGKGAREPLHDRDEF